MCKARKKQSKSVKPSNDHEHNTQPLPTHLLNRELALAKKHMDKLRSFPIHTIQDSYYDDDFSADLKSILKTKCASCTQTIDEVLKSIDGEFMCAADRHFFDKLIKRLTVVRNIGFITRFDLKRLQIEPIEQSAEVCELNITNSIKHEHHNMVDAAKACIAFKIDVIIPRDEIHRLLAVCFTLLDACECYVRRVQWVLNQAFLLSADINKRLGTMLYSISKKTNLVRQELQLYWLMFQQNKMQQINYHTCYKRVLTLYSQLIEKHQTFSKHTDLIRIVSHKFEHAFVKQTIDCYVSLDKVKGTWKEIEVIRMEASLCYSQVSMITTKALDLQYFNQVLYLWPRLLVKLKNNTFAWYQDILMTEPTQAINIWKSYKRALVNLQMQYTQNQSMPAYRTLAGKRHIEIRYQQERYNIYLQMHLFVFRLLRIPILRRIEICGMYNCAKQKIRHAVHYLILRQANKMIIEQMRPVPSPTWLRALRVHRLDGSPTRGCKCSISLKNKRRKPTSASERANIETIIRLLPVDAVNPDVTPYESKCRCIVSSKRKRWQPIRPSVRTHIETIIKLLPVDATCPDAKPCQSIVTQSHTFEPMILAETDRANNAAYLESKKPNQNSSVSMAHVKKICHVTLHMLANIAPHFTKTFQQCNIPSKTNQIIATTGDALLLILRQIGDDADHIFGETFVHKNQIVKSTILQYQVIGSRLVQHCSTACNLPFGKALARAHSIPSISLRTSFMKQSARLLMVTIKWSLRTAGIDPLYFSLGSLDRWNPVIPSNHLYYHLSTECLEQRRIMGFLGVRSVYDGGVVVTQHIIVYRSTESWYDGFQSIVRHVWYIKTIQKETFHPKYTCNDWHHVVASLQFMHVYPVMLILDKVQQVNM